MFSTIIPAFKQNYSAVDQESDNASARNSCDETNPEKGLLTNEPKSKKISRRRVLRRVTLGGVLLLLLGSHVLMWVLGRRSIDVNHVCLHHTSAFSPVLEVMEPEYKMVKFNGTLGFPSEFTGDPSPELDAVWDKWGYVKYASIPEETFMKLPGADPNAARLTPEYGGGYIGFLEVSHQMHCLNMLRQGIHQDYYNDPEHPERMAPVFTDRPYTVKIHLQHCIEIFRQNIMCNADVGIIPHQWITATPDPYANFNTWHKCRDISSVEKWIHEHEIPDTPDGSDIPIPLGSKIFAQPP